MKNETMNQRGKIEKILGNSATLVEDDITFIGRLFPEFNADLNSLICKKLSSPLNEQHHDFTNINSEPEYTEATDHDVTGSPLKHSFGEDIFNVTIVEKKKYWTVNEEDYVPMAKLDASVLLNLCIDEIYELPKPVFALCDGTDGERTILLGASRSIKQFETIKVLAPGAVGASKVQDCNALMQEHITIAGVPEHEVKVEITSSYELFGIDRYMIGWTKEEHENFEGFLGLDVVWDSLSFSPPVSPTYNYITCQISPGWRGSPLHYMWDQLVLLHKYMDIYESYQKKNVGSRSSIFPMTFPKDFFTPYFKKPECLLEQLNSLLSGDDDFDMKDLHDDPTSRRLFSDDVVLDDNAPVQDYLKKLYSRENLDFADQLWRIIISTDDYAQMTDCLHTVFEKIVDNLYKPEINEAQPTRLTNFIHDLTARKAGVPPLAGSLPLELVIDMGLEKMSRDYKYLLFSANLADFHNIRETLSIRFEEKFQVDKCRERLLTMAQIHICLEFLIVMQNNLDCSFDTSSSFFNHAIKSFVSSKSSIRSFADLLEHGIYTLKVPGSKATLAAIGKTPPNTWLASLSSSQKNKSVVTKTSYSLGPIFPPNIYTPDDPIDGEESFYVTKVIESHYGITSRSEQSDDDECKNVI